MCLWLVYGCGRINWIAKCVRVRMSLIMIMIMRSRQRTSQSLSSSLSVGLIMSGVLSMALSTILYYETNHGLHSQQSWSQSYPH